MEKHELLVPVQNMKCLYQAVHNGADAVYLGCRKFGARKFAINFSNEEIIEAIKYCHLYGVRIYVTMNTLIKDSEVDEFINQVRFLYKHGVDALIMQDFGMICLVREMFPELEIHASTQANISSIDTCRLYYKLGVKRVVFSRELSIDEINKIDVPIEKEAFIHGAVCISYSGECLMSSMLGGRSGNRGECAGCCRLPYSLYEGNKLLIKDKYLLSTKELNTTNYIKELLDSNIYSFKIEGRMKNEIYVGFITRLYRRLIDQEDIDLDKEIDKLKTIFNRDFTKGRIFNELDNNYLNIDSPNHIGLNIGKVISIDKDKIKIKLNKGRVLHQYDAIRFINKKDGFIVNYLYDSNYKLTNSISDIGYIDNKTDVEVGDIISITGSYLLNKEVLDYKRKKIKIYVEVIAKLGERLEIIVDDGKNKIHEYGNIVESSINRPVNRDLIYKQINRVKDTPFIIDKFNVDIDNNIFIVVRELNELRRNVINKLIDVRENRKSKYIEKDIIFDKDNFIKVDSGISCSVYTKEQIDVCLLLNVDRIYVRDRELYKEYSNYNNVYYMQDRCLYDYSNVLEKNNIVSDYMEYDNLVGNYSLNVMNSYTVYYLNRIGIKSVCLSVELDEDELNILMDNYNKLFGNYLFEVLVYGRICNMIIKGNILDISRNNYNYYLKDIKDRKFYVFYDGRITHILNYENKKINISKLNNIFIKRLDFYKESGNDIVNIIKMYRN